MYCAEQIKCFPRTLAIHCCDLETKVSTLDRTRFHSLGPDLNLEALSPRSLSRGLLRLQASLVSKVSVSRSLKGCKQALSARSRSRDFYAFAVGCNKRYRDPSVCPSVCLSHGAAAPRLAVCSFATAGHHRCADYGPVRGRT